MTINDLIQKVGETKVETIGHGLNDILMGWIIGSLIGLVIAMVIMFLVFRHINNKHIKFDDEDMLGDFKDYGDELLRNFRKRG